MSCNPLSSRPLIMAAFGLVLSACNGNDGLTTSAPSMTLSSQSFARASLKQVHPRSSGKIRHVVIIMQENRSLQQPFLRFPRGDEHDVRIRYALGKKSCFSRLG